MIDKEKVKSAVTDMTKNPDWREVLANAPGAANLRIALAFYASKNLSEMSQPEKDEYREFREQLERQLNAEELKYLAESFARMGVDAAKDHYNELFYKKPAEEQAAGSKAYAELMEKVREAKGAETGPEAPQEASDAEEGDGKGEGAETPPEGAEAASGEGNEGEER